MPTLAKYSKSSFHPPGNGTSGPRSVGSAGKLAPPRWPRVGLPVAMPSRPGTSRWVYVIVPTLAAGISRPLPLPALGAAKALTGPIGARATAAAPPTPSRSMVRRLRLWFEAIYASLRAPAGVRIDRIVRARITVEFVGR